MCYEEYIICSFSTIAFVQLICKCMCEVGDQMNVNELLLEI